LEPETNKYSKVYISFQISEEANKLLTESGMRSGRKNIPEAALRLEDHGLVNEKVSIIIKQNDLIS
jgi:hypothetical protein